MTFTDEELKELHTYLGELIEQAAKDKDPAEDEYTDLWRQLEVIGYSAMLFQDICEMCQVDFKVAGLPLDELPLHMFDEQPITRVIVKWRLSRGK